MKLVVTGSALADIERLHAFLKNKNRAAAQRVVSVLDGAMQSLRTAPERGRRSDVRGARELIVPLVDRPMSCATSIRPRKMRSLFSVFGTGASNAIDSPIETTRTGMIARALAALLCTLALAAPARAAPFGGDFNAFLSARGARRRAPASRAR